MAYPRMRSAVKEVPYILMFIFLLVLSFYVGRSYGRFEQLLLEVPKVPGFVKPSPSTKPPRKERAVYASHLEMTEDRQLRCRSFFASDTYRCA